MAGTHHWTQGIFDCWIYDETWCNDKRYYPSLTDANDFDWGQLKHVLKLIVGLFNQSNNRGIHEANFKYMECPYMRKKMSVIFNFHHINGDPPLQLFVALDLKIYPHMILGWHIMLSADKEQLKVMRKNNLQCHCW